MKTKYLIIVLLLFAIKTTRAQDPNNHWQLGVSDINFSTNPPIVTTVANNGQYGNASASDENGNLLFYTDGNKVWNKNHLEMPGNGYVGSNIEFLIRQPAIIVPFPGNLNKFYVFTSTVDINSPNNNSTYYSSYRYVIVDFTDNLYPLGKAINGGDLFFNGNSIFGPLTVVKNATNNGYFIILHSLPSTGNGGVLKSYKITSQGLDLTPVETYIPNNISFNNLTLGDPQRTTSAIIKFSPDNLKMGELVVNEVTTGPQPNNIYLSSRFFTLDFNNQTGTFNNFTIVDDNSSQVYSNLTIPTKDFEFSADSKKVYFINNNVYVKDLLSISTPPRNLFAINTSTVPNGFGHIQRDKNGEILISSYTSTNNGNKFLHKIDSQDSFNVSSVVLNNVDLNGNSITNRNQVLPQLIPSLNPPCPNNLTVSNNVASGIDKRQAQNLITATNTISSGASAIYHAISIVFSPSFTALSGSSCHFYSEGCTNTFVAKYASSTEKNLLKFQNETQTVNLNETVKISPNPNDGIFKINITDLLDGNIEIADLYGLTFYKKTFKNQSEFEINIQDRPKGIYVIKVISGEQVITKKIIKN